MAVPKRRRNGHLEFLDQSVITSVSHIIWWVMCLFTTCSLHFNWCYVIPVLLLYNMRLFAQSVGFVYIRELKRSVCEVSVFCLLYLNLNKECTNPSRRVAETTKCCMVARNICGPYKCGNLFLPLNWSLEFLIGFHIFWICYHHWRKFCFSEKKLDVVRIICNHIIFIRILVVYWKLQFTVQWHSG